MSGWQDSCGMLQLPVYFKGDGDLRTLFLPSSIEPFGVLGS